MIKPPKVAITSFIQSVLTKSKKQVPILLQLLQAAVKNYDTMPFYLQRVWPHWFYKQTQDVGDNNFFSISNSAHRNWTLLRETGVDASAIVDPSGLLHIPGSEYSLDSWLKTEDGLYFPSKDCLYSQVFNPQTGLVLTEHQLKCVTMTASVFYKFFIDQNDLVFSEYSVKNISNSKQNISLYLSIRPYSLEGITVLNSIQYLQSKTFLVNGQLAVFSDSKPDNVVCSTHAGGDVCEMLNTVEWVFQSQCVDGLASACLEYKLSLNPGEQKSILIKSIVNRPSQMSFFRKKQISKDIASKIEDISGFSCSREKEKLQQLIQKRNGLVKFRSPNKLWDNFFNTQQQVLFTALGSQFCFAGTYSDERINFIKTPEILCALAQCGYSAEQLELINQPDYFSKLIKAIQSRSITPSELGQMMLYLNQLTQVSVFIINADMFKNLEQAIASYLKDLENKSHKKQALLFPKRPCHYSGVLHYFLLDLIGALETINVLQDIAQKRHFSLDAAYLHMRSLVSAGIQTFCDDVSNKVVFKRIVPATLTAYLSIHSIETLYRYFCLFPKESERVHQTLTMIQEHFVESSLICSQFNPSGFPMHENVYFIKLCRLLNRNVYSSFDQLLGCQSSTGCFSEAIHRFSKKGSGLDGHSYSASALLLLEFSSFLVSVTDKSMTLCKDLPESWFKTGFAFQGLQTPFGSVSLTVTPKESSICVDCDWVLHNRCETVILSLPSSVSAVEMNQKRIEISDSTIVLPLTTKVLYLYFHES